MFSDIDTRLSSRLQGSERIRFDRYSIDELVAIMRARVGEGLSTGSIHRAELEQIADAAVGDARVALSILRSAARQAQQEGIDQITADIIDSAIPKARTEVRQKNLDVLTPHQKTLYEIIEDHHEIAPGILYLAYRERVENPKTDRTIRNYLRKMVRYNLIVARGTSRDRVYSIVKTDDEEPASETRVDAC